MIHARFVASYSRSFADLRLVTSLNSWARNSAAAAVFDPVEIELPLVAAAAVIDRDMARIRHQDVDRAFVRPGVDQALFPISCNPGKLSMRPPPISPTMKKIVADTTYRAPSNSVGMLGQRHLLVGREPVRG